ncbi:hypothetical protein ABK040_002735 [Willaertia magna]
MNQQQQQDDTVNNNIEQPNKPYYETFSQTPTTTTETSNNNNNNNSNNNTYEQAYQPSVTIQIPNDDNNNNGKTNRKEDLIASSTLERDFNQIHALFSKSLFLQIRQYRTNLCQLLFPMFCLLFIFILQAVLNTLVDGFINSAGVDSSVRVNATSIEASQLMIYAKNLLSEQEKKLLNDSSISKNITYFPPEAFYFTTSNGRLTRIFNTNINGMKLGFLSPYGLVNTSTVPSSSGYLSNLIPISRSVSTSVVNGTFDYFGNVQVPYSIIGLNQSYPDAGSVSKPKFFDEKSLDETLYDELGAVGRTEKLSAMGAYILRNLTLLNTFNSISYSIQYDKSDRTQFCKSTLRKAPLSYFITSCDYTLGVSLQNWMNDAFLRVASGNVGMRIRTYVAQMPYTTSIPSFAIADALGFFFYPLILCLLLPAFSFTIVFEKQFKLREMMKLMGLKLRYYFLVTYLFQYAIFIGRTIVATILSYMIVLIGPMAGVLLETAVFTNAPNAALPLLLVFPLQIVHFIWGAGTACNNFGCLSKPADIYDNKYVFYSLIFMYGTGLIYFILGLYFDAVLPVHGVGKHPLFFLQWMWKPFQKKSHVNIKVKDHPTEEDGVPVDTDVLEEVYRVNPKGYDIKQQKEHVNKLREQYGVVLYNLEKKYGLHRAVKGTNLLIGKSECFGLLGMNGAGKSTTINMLSGMFGPSEGTSFVYGCDIRYDIEKIHQMMGLTAQFDILYPDLSCEEHLLFYSRLKGVRRKYQQEHVNELLTQVGLDNYTLKARFSPLSGSLSGGMKRRLSIAISLVADPKLILLDEPTTGLDPTSKRHLWNIILDQKKNRTIILTTHSMEEADVLCDRMTIMSKGRFHCLGSGIHLKNKFGDGYLLTTSYELDKENEVEQYLLDYVPEAEKILKLTGTTVYKIPVFQPSHQHHQHLQTNMQPTSQVDLKETIDNTASMSTVVNTDILAIEPSIVNTPQQQHDNKHDRSIAGLFKHMEKSKSIGLKEWAINQVSLEQVFLNIVKKDSERNVMREEDKEKCVNKRSTVLLRQCICN